jgi:hypothetical protein
MVLLPSVNSSMQLKLSTGDGEDVAGVTGVAGVAHLLLDVLMRPKPPRMKAVLLFWPPESSRL